MTSTAGTVVGKRSDAFAECSLIDGGKSASAISSGYMQEK